MPKSEDLPASGIEGHDAEVELVFGLEHDLLLRHLEQGRGSEGGADAEQGQRGLLRFSILAMEGLYAAPDV